MNTFIFTFSQRSASDWLRRALCFPKDHHWELIRPLVRPSLQCRAQLQTWIDYFIHLQSGWRRAAKSTEAGRLTALNTLPSRGPGGSQRLLFPPSLGGREGPRWAAAVCQDSYSYLKPVQTSNERAVGERRIEAVCKVQGHLSFFYVSDSKSKKLLIIPQVWKKNSPNPGLYGVGLDTQGAICFCLFLSRSVAYV